MDLHAFLNDPAGLALKGMLVAAFLNLAFGLFGAFRDNSFDVTAIAAFARKHLMGRVFPIGSLLVAGWFTGDLAMNAAAGAAATLYTVETLGSIYASIKPPAAR